MIKEIVVQTNYKFTQYGPIPKDWQYDKFENIILEMRSGAPLKPEDFKDNGFKILPKSGVTRGGSLIIGDGNQQYCNESYMLAHANNIIDNTFLILVLRDLVPSGPNIGLIVKLPNPNQFLLAQGVYGFKLKNTVIHDYVVQLSNSTAYRRIMNRIMVGSTQVHITNTEFLKVELPLPSISEQKKIAAILNTWDEAIAKTQQLIYKLQERNKTLTKQVLKPKKNWNEFKISDVFERVTKKNIEGHQNVITISAQRGFVKQDDYFKKIIASEILDNYFIVERGDFCYNKSYSNGYDWGAIKRLNDFDKAVVTTLYICFRQKDKILTSGLFFELFFESGKLENGLSKVAHEGGRAHGLLNVTPGDFFNLKIVIPNLLEQNKIATILQTAANELKLCQQQLSSLQLQKKGLMQKLLTGKIRVK